MTVEQGTFWRNILDPELTVQATYVFGFDGPSYVCFSTHKEERNRRTLNEEAFLEEYEPITNLDEIAMKLLGHGAV